MEKQIREEKIISGKVALEDIRGNIINYELTEPINWIGLIKTNLNGEEFPIRANHYHPMQEQKVLVISGSYISLYKDLLDKESPIKHHLIRGGDLVITPPNIAHAQIFLEDTVLLNLVHGERKTENFGKHTIPYELIKPEDKDTYLKMYLNKK